MKKRLVALLLVLTLVIGTAATSVMAGEGLTQDYMSKVILGIKNKLEIGDEFTNFNYDYYDYSGSGIWYFDWQTADYTKYISVECDEDMHIMSYYLSTNEQKTGAPNHTKAELLPVAEKAVYKLCPELEGHIAYESASYSSWRSAYNYYFVREENGVKMPDNRVSVMIGYLDENVYNFNCSWDYEVKIVPAENIMTEAEAAEKAGEAVEMTLRYYIGWDEAGNKTVFLAYTPDKPYVAVDAVSGEIYEEKEYWDRGGANSATKTEAADTVACNDEAATGFKATLSDAELEKIADLEKLISSEDAVKVVTENESLYIDPNVNMTNVTLRQSSASYYWRVQMKDARLTDHESGDYYRGSAYANVDAVTGELLSFSATVPQYYNYEDDKMPEELKTVKYTKAQCRELAEKFLEKTSPERFASSELGDEYETRILSYDYKIGMPTYGGYHFGYVRVNQGIQLQANYLSCSIDAVSGKIFEYSAVWDDELVLPATDNVIGEKSAFESYIGYDGFDLVYELITDYSTEENFYGYDSKTSTRLVYRTEINPNYVDAFTGKQLNYIGQPYEKNSTELAYTDIAGTKYERAITLLADMGAGFEGSEFKPDDVISRDEFAKLASMVPGVYTYNYDLKGGIRLTRRFAAKALVSWLGYGDIAKFDIYKTGFSDNKKIGADYRGYVALANVYGLMDAYTDNEFRPTESVTRGEAADLLIRYINIAK